MSARAARCTVRGRSLAKDFLQHRCASACSASTSRVRLFSSSCLAQQGGGEEDDGLRFDQSITAKLLVEAHRRRDESKATLSKGKAVIEKRNGRPQRWTRGSPVPLFAAREGRRAESAGDGQETPSDRIRDSSGGRLRRLVTADKVRIQANDPNTLKLLDELNVQVTRNSMAGAIKVCSELKNYLEEKARTLTKSETAKAVPPFSVYVALLQIFGGNGQFAMCQDIMEDLQTTLNKSETLSDLDSLLFAAVLQGDVSIVDWVLHKFAAPPVESDEHMPEENDIEGVHPKEGKPDRANIKETTTSSPFDQQRASTSSQPGILSQLYMRNWTVQTYRSMLRFCQITRNPEYALALLGAASQRSKDERLAEEQLTGTLSEPAAFPFLTRVLGSGTVRDVLQTMSAARQGRLMADLALWMDEGSALRKVDVPMWMNVLRCCADVDYYPGVELAWERAVQQGQLTPDEGLWISVMNCAARAQQPMFVEQTLAWYKAHAPPSFELQEWHLMPLFEAQCAQHDFASAFRTAGRLARLDDKAVRTTSGWRFAALVHEASSSSDVAERAYDAFISVGCEHGKLGGATTEVLNALIRAASFLRMNDMAVKLYGVRRYVVDGAIPGNTCRAAKLPELYNRTVRFDDDTESVMQTLSMIRAEEEKLNKHEPTWGLGLEANVQTFNALLSTAINLGSATMGKYVFQQLNIHQVAPDAAFYERAIVLAVTQPVYEDAFKLLTECSSSGITPTRDAYKAVVRRCRSEDDDRWIGMAKQMLEHNYFPGSGTIYALVGHNHVRKQEILRRFPNHRVDVNDPYGPGE